MRIFENEVVASTMTWHNLDTSVAFPVNVVWCKSACRSCIHWKISSSHIGMKSSHKRPGRSLVVSPRNWGPVATRFAGLPSIAASLSSSTDANLALNAAISDSASFAGGGGTFSVTATRNLASRRSQQLASLVVGDQPFLGPRNERLAQAQLNLQWWLLSSLLRNLQRILKHCHLWAGGVPECCQCAFQLSDSVTCSSNGSLGRSAHPFGLRRMSSRCTATLTPTSMPHLIDLRRLTVFPAPSAILWSLDCTRGHRGFTRQPENSKRAHFRARRFETPPKFHEKTPRGKKRTNFPVGEGKQSAKFWAPHPSGLHPSGLHPFGGSTLRGLHPSGLHPSGPWGLHPSDNPRDPQG